MKLARVGMGRDKKDTQQELSPAGSRKEPESRQEKRRKGRQERTKKQKPMLEGGKIQPSLGFLPHVTFCHLRSENSTVGRLSSPPQCEVRKTNSCVNNFSVRQVTNRKHLHEREG